MVLINSKIYSKHDLLYLEYTDTFSEV